MKALVVGGGGREHALVWKLASSRYIDQVHCAPGNPGAAGQAELHEVPVTDTEAMVDLARRLGEVVVVVGPEAPLAAGMADALGDAGIRCFGPRQSAARLESSKRYAKQLMQEAGIPTAAARSFDDAGEATAYVRRAGRPVVVKADGLAAGKGVTVCRSAAEAEAAVADAMSRRRFGDAGSRVLVEERLEGPELSVLGLCDGGSVVALPAAQDFKRAFDGDGGPNTGGMGAYSPVPACTPEVSREVMERVFEPCVRALGARGERYIGVIYAGLMLTEQGLQVIEFNCRFGDPETQAILPRLEADLGELILAATEGSLAGVAAAGSPRACVSVVAASGGYPEQDPLQVGFEIRGLEDVDKLEDVTVFHAATRAESGRLVTSGGRVLAVSALGDDLEAARSAAYDALDRISFQGMRFRSDIAAPR